MPAKRSHLGVRAGFNYLQSVTPRLALGGETFWLNQNRKSGTGFSGRYQGTDCVATAQIASTGIVSLTYTQRISEKVLLTISSWVLVPSISLDKAEGSFKLDRI